MAWYLVKHRDSFTCYLYCGTELNLKWISHMKGLFYILDEEVKEEGLIHTNIFFFMCCHLWYKETHSFTHSLLNSLQEVRQLISLGVVKLHINCGLGYISVCKEAFGPCCKWQPNGVLNSLRRMYQFPNDFISTSLICILKCSTNSKIDIILRRHLFYYGIK